MESKPPANVESAPAIVATPNLEISAMSVSTKILVAKLMAEKKKSEGAQKKEEVITIKPYSAATQELISRLKTSP